MVVQFEEVCRLHQQQIARLSSPPQERADIVERHAARLDFLRTHDYPLSSDPPGSDIDTLLGDCAAWRNAHQDRVQMLSVVQDSLSERNRECVELRQRIERLEAALRQIKTEGTKTQTRRVGDMYSDDGWEQYEVVTHAAQLASEALAAADVPALTASQQHTAGSGDGVAGD